MSLATLIREAAKQPHSTDDEEPAPLELGSGMSHTDIDTFEATLPCRLPGEVRELLAVSTGFTGGAADFVDFTGRSCMFEQREIFPNGHPIAADGYGNFWVVDLLPDAAQWGPIYFACHDAPVVLFQSPSLEHFLVELFRLSQPPY